MIVRAYGLKKGTSLEAKDELSFSDRNKISTWAVPYVTGAATLELVKGRGENKFVPKGLATVQSLLK